MLSSTRLNSLLAEYDRLMRSVKMGLLAHYPAKVVWGVFSDARPGFARLIPQIPSIGTGHIWQFNLDASAMTLAVSRTLKKYGFTKGESVQWVYHMFEAYLNHYPSILRWGYRKYYFSPFSRDRLRYEATRSQRCEHPASWVFDYLEGDGKRFDFGVDIHECAIQKFYCAQNAEEFTPCFCLLDHAMGERLGLGFFRQSTLVGGANVCDCRWKLGAATQHRTPLPELFLQNTMQD